MKKSKITLIFRFLFVMGFLSLNSITNAQSVEEALRNLEVEKFGTATSTIRKVIEKDSKNARNYYYAGYIYLSLGRPDSAQYFFNQGVTTDAKEALSYVGQGHIALNNGKIQEAQGLFDKALSLSREKDAVVYNKIAEAFVHAETKDANKALTYLQKALSLKKGKDEASKIDAETQLLMGDAYMLLNDGGKAASAYDRAVTLDPKMAKAYVKMGRIYLIPKNDKAAEEQFQKAVQADPSYAPVFIDLGELYFTFRKDLKKAREYYEKYLQLSDVKTGSRSRYAIFTFLTRDYPLAVKELQNAITQEPNNIVLNRLLGYSLYETGDYQGALNYLNKYFSIVKPDKTIAKDYEYQGKTLIKLGQDSLAIQSINEAIKLDTSNIDLLSDIGEEYRKAKKFKEASKLYRELLNRKKEPTATDYYWTGYSCLYAQQAECAETNFLKVTELQPDKPYGWVYLAQTVNQFKDPQGEKGLATPYYEKAIPILEADTTGQKFVTSSLLTAYFYLGYQSYLKNNIAAAKQYLEKIKAIDPAHKNIPAYEEMLNPKPQKAAPKKSAASKESK